MPEQQEIIDEQKRLAAELVERRMNEREANEPSEAAKPEEIIPMDETPVETSLEDRRAASPRPIEVLMETDTSMVTSHGGTIMADEGNVL